jgi:hypothetical protein
VSAIIYLEGGGDSKELHTRCREGFRRLLERCGFQGRMPRLVACGGRTATFNDFSFAHNGKNANFVAMWIDSEDLLAQGKTPWDHLRTRDNWIKPVGANDDQILFMTTCMETWLVADKATLIQYFGSELQDSALPPIANLENRDRHAIQNALANATRNCSNPYTKGKKSFELLGKLTPAVLAQYLPSFVRARDILHIKL